MPKVRELPVTYEFHTDDPEKAATAKAREYPELFLWESVGTFNSGKRNYKVYWQCSMPSCHGHTTNYAGALCKACSNELKKKKPFERTFNKCLKAAPRTKANGFSIEWRISYEEFIQLCRIEDCHYCQEPLNRAEFKSDVGSVAMLLDRKDSNDHYTVDNVVPCCANCNDIKSHHLSYDDMLLVMAHRKGLQNAG